MSELVPTDPEAQVYHLRKSGMSFLDIAERLAISSAEAIAAFRRYTVTLAASYSLDERQALVQLELERLNDLQAAVWAPATAGDRASIETALKIMAHRSKLLQLDAVTPVDNQQVQNILVVGGDQETFLEALRAGRKKAVTSADPENEDDLREAP